MDILEMRSLGFNFASVTGALAEDLLKIFEIRDEEKKAETERAKNGRGATEHARGHSIEISSHRSIRSVYSIDIDGTKKYDFWPGNAGEGDVFSYTQSSSRKESLYDEITRTDSYNRRTHILTTGITQKKIPAADIGADSFAVVAAKVAAERNARVITNDSFEVSKPPVWVAQIEAAMKIVKLILTPETKRRKQEPAAKAKPRPGRPEQPHQDQPPVAALNHT